MTKMHGEATESVPAGRAHGRVMCFQPDLTK
jgi:hypothetical protein